MNYKILVLPGDGIGKEVIPETLKILTLLEDLFEAFSFNFTELEIGGQHWLETGEEAPADLIDVAKKNDAVFFGGVGWPKAVYPDGNLVGIKTLLKLRFDLDLYANIRPVKLYPGVDIPVKGKKPAEIDFVVVRENTEGLYVQVGGELKRGSKKEEAVDVRIITRKGCERIIEKAFQVSLKRKGAPLDGKKRVTIVDKSNVLKGCLFFRETFKEVGKKYPNVEKNFSYVDAWTIQVIKSPEKFDVVVTTNMFGDIITDLASVLQGGLGLAPSGNIGDKHAMFEPVHGTAPDIYGKHIANPLASVLSAKLMIEWLAEQRNDRELEKGGELIEEAVAQQLKKGKVRTPDLGGMAKTEDVINNLKEIIKYLYRKQK